MKASITGDCKLIITFNLRGGEAEEAIKVLCDTMYLYKMPGGKNPINDILRTIIGIRDSRSH